jgi:hypothetical protein
MNKINNVAQFAVILLFALIFSGCKKEKANGFATFYYPNYGPTAVVSINGQTRTITQIYDFNGPGDCNANGCANYTLPEGNYSYTAQSSIFNWSGNFSVYGNQCSIVQLANANVTFWTSGNYPNLTVTIGGQTASVTQQYASPGPNNCSAAGCANFFLTSGTYPYSAKSGSTTWSGSLTVDQTSCSLVEVQ